VKVALYANVGADLTQYDVDVAAHRRAIDRVRERPYSRSQSNQSV